MERSGIFLLLPKSLYISPAVTNFYGTEIEIFAGFGPVGNTEKKILGPIISNFVGIFFLFLWAKNKFKFKKIYIEASALKSGTK